MAIVGKKKKKEVQANHIHLRDAVYCETFNGTLLCRPHSSRMDI